MICKCDDANLDGIELFMEMESPTIVDHCDGVVDDDNEDELCCQRIANLEKDLDIAQQQLLQSDAHIEELEREDEKIRQEVKSKYTRELTV